MVSSLSSSSSLSSLRRSSILLQRRRVIVASRSFLGTDPSSMTFSATAGIKGGIMGAFSTFRLLSALSTCAPPTLLSSSNKRNNNINAMIHYHHYPLTTVQQRLNHFNNYYFHYSIPNSNTNQILHRTITTTHYCQPTKILSRKADKMGQHLKTLDEMAHRKERSEAQERRKKKKEKSKKNRIAHHHHHDAEDEQQQDEEKTTLSTPPAIETSTGEKVPPSLIFIDPEHENETIFEHGTDDSLIPPSLPDPLDVKARMIRIIHSLEQTLKSIRGAEPTPELFDSVTVRAYGTPDTPLAAVAQVVIASPNQVTISCYDPELSRVVRDAVRDMPGMNFNPRIEGDESSSGGGGGSGTIIVPVPKVSAETRKALVKQLGQLAESGRTRIRNIRRGAQSVIKKGKDGKLEGVSKDDAFRVGKEIDAVTDEVVQMLNDIVEKKQQAVMAV